MADALLDWEGPLSPPRRNGELVFDTVWESRVFGLTMTLHEAGYFPWPAFRDRLIDEIARWEHVHGARDEGFRYWECWLRAFEGLVADTGLCPADVLAARVRELAARPAGHDH